MSGRGSEGKKDLKNLGGDVKMKVKRWILCNILDKHDMSGTRIPEGAGPETICTRCGIPRWKHYERSEKILWYKFLGGIYGSLWELWIWLRGPVRKVSSSGLVDPFYKLSKWEICARVGAKIFFIVSTVLTAQKLMSFVI